mmetsp:Transcript_9144/g.16785  ORF Transcript_9144/g.16785 Transcript_9144/m.16785 type:complete len:269 (-) Transcript_9144:92-898(-)
MRHILRRAAGTLMLLLAVGFYGEGAFDGTARDHRCSGRGRPVGGFGCSRATSSRGGGLTRSLRAERCRPFNGRRVGGDSSPLSSGGPCAPPAALGRTAGHEPGDYVHPSPSRSGPAPGLLLEPPADGENGSPCLGYGVPRSCTQPPQCREEPGAGAGGGADLRALGPAAGDWGSSGHWHIFAHEDPVSGAASHCTGAPKLWYSRRGLLWRRARPDTAAAPPPDHRCAANSVYHGTGAFALRLRAGFAHAHGRRVQERGGGPLCSTIHT